MEKWKKMDFWKKWKIEKWKILVRMVQHGTKMVPYGTKMVPYGTITVP